MLSRGLDDIRSPRRRRYLCDISNVDKLSRPKNVPSTWHTKEDNDKFFDQLGVDTFTIATGLCVLKCGSKGFLGYEEFRGVAVFAKDFMHRCNFIRIYHITTFELLYEIELLDMFLFKLHRSDRKKLTIKMGIHYADMIFAERGDMLQFKRKLCRIGIEKIKPSLVKRIQNCWDNTKKILGNVIHEKKSNESAIVNSVNEYSYNDSNQFYTPMSSKLLSRKNKSGDFSKYDRGQRCGIKRKITVNDQDSVYCDVKRQAKDQTNSKIRVVNYTVYSPKTPTSRRTPELINLPPSPPETPRGILKGHGQTKLVLNNCNDETLHVVKSEIKQVNFNSTEAFTLGPSESLLPPPPTLKGAVRTVPRPCRNPPPPPPLENRILVNNDKTPTTKVIPSDLLAEIRSAPQLRGVSKINGNMATPHSLSTAQSPLHLIRSAMLTRRKSIKEDESEDEGTRSTFHDTTDWSVNERYHEMRYPLK